MDRTMEEDQEGNRELELHYKLISPNKHIENIPVNSRTHILFIGLWIKTFTKLKELKS